MRMSQFPGLITAVSPYLLPAGAATQQTNLTSLTPGRLTVRGGITKLADLPERALEAWSYLIGSGQNDIVLVYGENGKLYAVRGIGGTPFVDELSSDLLAGTPTSFAQGRRNEVYVFQGNGQRPLTINSNLVARQIGMDPPTAAPVVVVRSSENSGYVARIDIVEAGFGYIDAPAVTVSPPPAGGRTAKAVARIADKAVNVIQVTDGGAGYDRAPAVIVSKPTATPSYSQGRDAELQLQPGHPAGNYKQGVVYWEPWLEGTPLGVTEVNDRGTVENGVTFCTTVPPSKDGLRPARNMEYWNGGLLQEVCTDGAGRGAKVYFPLTELGKQILSWIYPTENPNDPSNLPQFYPNPCNENFPSFCSFSDEQMREVLLGMPGDLGSYFGYPQVYDFGTGYQPGDEVWAYIHTANYVSRTFAIGSLYISFCGQAGQSLCPYVFKGHVYGAEDTPPNVTIKAASPIRQRPLSTVIKNPGSGYTIAPDFLADDLRTFPSEIDPATGSVVAVYPDSPSTEYLWAPEVIDPQTQEARNAVAQAIMRPNFRGEYRCYYRFVNDSVPESDGGPLFSSLSPLTDVDVGDSAASLEWTIPPIPSHATGIELFRTTANQKATIFRVVRLGGTSDISEPYRTVYVDTLSDWDITDGKREDFLAIPVTLSDGSINANRYGIPSGDFAVGVMFQDRLWIGVDTTGKRPNTLMYSEADEPESMPEINELILQTNLRDTDYITALVPYAAALVVFQSKACHRLTYVDNPQSDGNVALLAYRGCCNQRCWDLHEGVLYAMDDLGVYAMTESGQVTPISQQIDDLFRRNTDANHDRVDPSKRQWYMLRTDRDQKVIRVFVSFMGDEGDYPTRQLCYSIENKAWWAEEYPTIFTAGTECRTQDGEVISLAGDGNSLQRLADGLTDNGMAVPYTWKSGNSEFATDAQKGGDQANPRDVSVTYEPTAESSVLNLSLYYNGSPTPRNSLASRDRGVGFKSHEGTPEYTLDMIRNAGRGDAPAIASALFAGKSLRDIYGNDRFVAIELHGEQTAAGQVAIHEIEVNGVLDK